jgi:flagellar protein FlgJ
MINSAADSAKLAHRSYTDLNALQGIRRQDKAGAVKEVAKQFESLYVQMMLKSMRSANSVFSESNYFNSSEMKFHQESLDNQLSLSLSEGPGIGLAGVLIKQLSGHYKQADLDVAIANADSADSSAASKTDGGLQQYFDHPLRIKNAPFMPVKETPADVSIQEANARSDQTALADIAINSPEQFVHALWPLAQQTGEKLGVDPRAILAQSALETGWGHSVSPQGDKNFFGIKADANWPGESVSRKTLEHRDGWLQTERAQFRSYSSYADSFADYASFLQNNPRYQQALQTGENPHQFARELQEAGYATDPHYANKISRIIDGDLFRNALNTSIGQAAVVVSEEG